MNSADVSGPWFNPNSSSPMHRKIILYLKNCISADTVNKIKQLLKTMGIYKASPAGEVSANSRSSPSVVSVVQNRTATSSSSRASSLTNLLKIIGPSRPPDVSKKSSCHCGKCHGKIRPATQTTWKSSISFRNRHISAVYYVFYTCHVLICLLHCWNDLLFVQKNLVKKPFWFQ